MDIKKRIAALLLSLTVFFGITISANAQTMYAPDGRTIEVSQGDVWAWKSVGWYEYPVVTMYAPDGRTVNVSTEAVGEWEIAGWTDGRKTITIYAPDGRTAIIPLYQLQAYLNVGWYDKPLVTMYSIDGRWCNIPESQTENYHSLGWYYTPVEQLYASGKKRIVVPLSEVYSYRQVGWHTLQSFLLSHSMNEIEVEFGAFQYDFYYAGTPNSGDIPRTYYKSSSPPNIVMGVNQNYAAHISLYLKDVFPYITLYADENGKVSVDTLNKILNDDGIYGRSYRDTQSYTSAFGTYYPLKFYDFDDKWVYGAFDDANLSIETDAYGNIDIYTARCGFDTLT